MITKISKRIQLAARVFFTGEIRTEPRGEIPALTPDDVAEFKVFFPLDKFFIFGHARSGTTLLTRLIRLHPAAHCNYQGHFFTRKPTMDGLVDSKAIESWLTRRSNRWNRGGDLSPVVMRAAVEFVMEREARQVGATVVGDKSPNGLLNGEAVRRMVKIYPEGKLIFIVRDGRDAVISHRFQQFIDAQQHLTKQDWAIRKDFEKNPEPFMNGERSIYTQSGIRRSAESWVRNVTETNRMGQELFGDQQYISVRYEDLLKNSWEQMKRLWKFLGVETKKADLPEILEKELGSNPDAQWQRQKAGELVEPLKKGKSGSWRDLFTKRDKQIFKEIAGRTLQDWGYEKDLDW
ncbi:MAG: sulfotransferase [Anaerolineales bacterium]|nr:sulfotransferase [Chloroflexota bacterium]MBL6979858.1 sulfotransferase [Anaerolineales bacterium]